MTANFGVKQRKEKQRKEKQRKEKQGKEKQRKEKQRKEKLKNKVSRKIKMNFNSFTICENLKEIYGQIIQVNSQVAFVFSEQRENNLQLNPLFLEKQIKMFNEKN
jgi:DNA invertase Pin-like site-specific DNA recombinase